MDGFTSSDIHGKLSLRASITSKFSNKTSIFAFAAEKVEELNTLKQMIEANRIKPVIDEIYSYEQAAEAHLRVETEQRLGAVVICPYPRE